VLSCGYCFFVALQVLYSVHVVSENNSFENVFRHIVVFVIARII